MRNQESPSSPARPIQVFYAYSHKDEALRNKLATHLSILQRNGIISGWHDRQIPAGNEWTDKIDDNLNAADIILLLVSPEFLASTYCYDKEMRRAMQRHEAQEARVIPVAIKPCLWEVAPFSTLQGLPKDMKAVTTWANRDEAFREIATGIQKVAEELRQRPPKPLMSDPAPYLHESEGSPAKRNVIASAAREGGRAHRAKWQPDSTTLLRQGPHIAILIGRTEADLSESRVTGSEIRVLPIRALIDTGASLTLINPQIAATCGLRQTGHQMVCVVGGQVREFPEYAASISFPGTPLPNLDATRVVACPIEQRYFSCLIGRDILRGWLMTYDGPNGEVEIQAR